MNEGVAGSEGEGAWGYRGIMEKKMETTILLGHIGFKGLGFQVWSWQSWKLAIWTVVSLP